MHTGAGSEIDNQVGGFNGRFVMLNHQNSVANFLKTPESAQQHVVVARMKPNGGLVEDIADAAQIRAELRCETNTLRFAAGEGVRTAVEG